MTDHTHWMSTPIHWHRLWFCALHSHRLWPHPSTHTDSDHTHLLPTASDHGHVYPQTLNHTCPLQETLTTPIALTDSDHSCCLPQTLTTPIHYNTLWPHPSTLTDHTHVLQQALTTPVHYKRVWPNASTSTDSDHTCSLQETFTTHLWLHSQMLTMPVQFHILTSGPRSWPQSSASKNIGHAYLLTQQIDQACPLWPHPFTSPDHPYLLLHTLTYPVHCQRH